MWVISKRNREELFQKWVRKYFICCLSTRALHTEDKIVFRKRLEFHQCREHGDNKNNN